jgi:hypothetical protein
MGVEGDVSIRINVHELRILGIWAEHYAVRVDQQNLDEPNHESLAAVVYAVLRPIREQLKALGKDAPLTLQAEAAELEAAFWKCADVPGRLGGANHGRGGGPSRRLTGLQRL